MSSCGVGMKAFPLPVQHFPSTAQDHLGQERERELELSRLYLVTLVLNFLSRCRHLYISVSYHRTPSYGVGVRNVIMVRKYSGVGSRHSRECDFARSKSLVH